MKLASLKEGGRDGTLVVVDRDLKKVYPAGQAGIPTVQRALEDWSRFAPTLEEIYSDLNDGGLNSFVLDPMALAAPLPRSYQFLDGSAYLSHVKRVRKARGAEMPPNFETDPLMYQGNSSRFLGPRDPIYGVDEEWGIDFEAEIAVVTDDVPMGVTSRQAGSHIRLLMLVNDISLRNLITPEVAKGFGFLHGKPGCAFSPVAVTPDELEDAWDGQRVHLPLITKWNSVVFGRPNAGEDMHFDFSMLISHAAKTRELFAGTIIGSGTVSNSDTTHGCSCIVEQRLIEILESGKPVTPFMRYGDQVSIDMYDSDGRSIFGAIEQEVKPCPS